MHAADLEKQRKEKEEEAKECTRTKVPFEPEPDSVTYGRDFSAWPPALDPVRCLQTYLARSSAARQRRRYHVTTEIYEHKLRGTVSGLKKKRQILCDERKRPVFGHCPFQVTVISSLGFHCHF